MNHGWKRIPAVLAAAWILFSAAPARSTEIEEAGRGGNAAVTEKDGRYFVDINAETGDTVSKIVNRYGAEAAK